MQLTQDQLWALHPTPSQQRMIMDALAPYETLQEAWEAGKAALSQTQWQFDGKDGLDDTADGYYYCDFLENDVNTVLQPVIAGIMAVKLLGMGKCTLRSVEQPYETNFYRVKLSEASTRALAILAPGMQLSGRFKEAGRVSNHIFAR